MIFSGMKNPGCLGCTHETGRRPGCHSKCKRYLAYKEELTKLIELRNEDNLKNKIFEESVYDHTARRRKKWK